jgi:carboxyl-terminal processing protease
MKTWIKNLTILGTGVLGGAMLTVGLTAYAFMGESPFPTEDLANFSRVYATIKRVYVEPVEDKKLIADAISGMLSKLDPHSAYLDKTEYKALNESMQGSFIGVGMVIDTEDGFIKVQSPIEGGPAERAGIRSGDLITKIEAKSTKNMSTSDAVKLLRGEMATKVTITVSRRGDTLPMIITLTRETIKQANLRNKILDGDNGLKVGYVRINQFQERTSEELVAELLKIDAQFPDKKGPKHLILDLRNNGGGALHASIGVSAAFLPADKLIVSVRGRVAAASKQFNSSRENYRHYDNEAKAWVDDPLKGLPAWARTVPMTLLINQGSASASEIVAGALKDYGRAKILGIRSFGKGSVQSIEPLNDGTAIKITTTRYYTPKDLSIQGKGISPDFNVDETAEGNPFAEFMTREGDNERALDADKNNKAVAEKTSEERAKEEIEKLKRLEKLRAEGRKPVELGVLEKDYQLQQAMNLIQGKPVATIKEEARKDDVKDSKDSKDGKDGKDGKEDKK